MILWGDNSAKAFPIQKALDWSGVVSEGAQENRTGAPLCEWRSELYINNFIEERAVEDE
jgi:hypothetical protein